MRKNEYHEMAKYEDTYWWHIGRLSIIDKQLTKIANINKNKKMNILNIGCGTGGTVKLLSKYGKVTNVDISNEALKYLRKKGFDGLKIDGAKLPFENDKFDLIIALDVLEHIEMDQSSLSEWQRVLKTGGFMLITVPAYQSLWSGHDVALHHFRRYTTKRLDWDLKKVSMDSVKLTYAVSFSLPLVVGFRVLHSLSGKTADSKTSYVSVPPIVNQLFVNILKFESRILRYVDLPFGTTVMGIFKK